MTDEIQQTDAIATEVETEAPKKKKNYLNQRDLYEEIIRCKMNNNIISDKLGNMFLLLASRYVNHRDFVRYNHIREDLIALGAMACCRAFYKFAPYSDMTTEWDENTFITYDYTVCSNPFAYMTTSVRNAFLQFLKREYAYSNAINATRLKEGFDASYGYTEMVLEKEAEQKSLESDSNEVDHLDAVHLWEEEPKSQDIQW